MPKLSGWRKFSQYLIKGVKEIMMPRVIFSEKKSIIAPAHPFEIQKYMFLRPTSFGFVYKFKFYFKN